MKLIIATSRDSLSGLPEPIAAYCRDNGLTSREETALRLVLEELATNSIMHGGAAPDADIRIELSQAGAATRLHYSDAGTPFDPRTDAPEDTRFEGLDDRPVGGLGWPLILTYFRLDSYRYKDGRNHMTLTADWSSPTEAEAR